MNFAKKVARKVENRLAGKVAGAITDSAVKGAKSVASKGRQAKTEVPKDQPVEKRNISKDIKRHKRAFDYLIIPTDEGRMFVIDGSMKLEKAVEMYLRFFPTADPMANYSEGRARYNVTTQSYELVPEDAPVQGTFPVHVIRMEV